MVAVEVGDEYLHFPVKTHFALHHLALDVFAAVEHQLVTWALNHHAGEAALEGWYAAACSQEHYAKTHVFTFSNTAISRVRDPWM